MSSRDYQQGKIYKILNTVDDECYIGSTTANIISEEWLSMGEV
jgi:hypothetical protein